MLTLICSVLGELKTLMPLPVACRILVMERLRGVPLTDLAAIKRVTDVDPESVLVNALNTWFGSVLACETFHADMYVLWPTLETPSAVQWLALPPRICANLIRTLELH